MQSYWPYSDAHTCRAFCRKLLPVNDGQVLAWRSANGLFFCTEFCADDADTQPGPRAPVTAVRHSAAIRIRI